MSRPNKFILKEEDAVEVIGNIYIFKCLDCKNQVKSKRSAIKQHSGKCKSCAQRKRPFESIFASLTRSDNFASRQSTLTYEEFLTFTKVKNCHYCTAKINWIEFRQENDMKRYYLDRKDSGLGYHVYNLVVCCTSCNYFKSDKFTYDEFKLLSSGLTEVAKRRNLC